MKTTELSQLDLYYTPKHRPSCAFPPSPPAMALDSVYWLLSPANPPDICISRYIYRYRFTYAGTYIYIHIFILYVYISFMLLMKCCAFNCRFLTGIWSCAGRRSAGAFGREQHKVSCRELTDVLDCRCRRLAGAAQPRRGLAEQGYWGFFKMRPCLKS